MTYARTVCTLSDYMISDVGVGSKGARLAARHECTGKESSEEIGEEKRQNEAEGHSERFGRIWIVD